MGVRCKVKAQHRICSRQKYESVKIKKLKIKKIDVLLICAEGPIISKSFKINLAGFGKVRFGL